MPAQTHPEPVEERPGSPLARERDQLDVSTPEDGGERIVIDGRNIPGLQRSPLAAALAAFQAEYPTVRKDKTALVTHDKGSYRYSYADLAEISPVVMPLLGKHGLSFSSRPMLDEHGRFVLRYELLHASGETRGGDYPLPDPSRAGAQSIGSAITYARRYALNAVTGLAPDDGSDDDGQAATNQPASGYVAEHPDPSQSRDRPAGQDAKVEQKHIGALMGAMDDADIPRGEHERKDGARQLLQREQLDSWKDLTMREFSWLMEYCKKRVDQLNAPAEEGTSGTG